MPVELSESLSGLPVELLTSATTKPPPSISEIPMRQIQPGELIVAGEVYDFHRWTNRKVDSDLMQDAFDEYSDF
mgnify:CR=1 FL=1